MKLERTPLGNYLEGRFVKIVDPNGCIKSLNPGDLDQPQVEFPISYEHVNDAVGAAKRAFIAWRRMPASDRSALVSRYKETLEKRKEVLAAAISFETGKPLWEARDEVSSTIHMIDYFLSMGSKTATESEIHIHNPHLKEQNFKGAIHYNSLGVTVVVSASNLPVKVSHHHMIPGLIDGNTTVLKASKHAPFAGQVIAECFHEAGFPPGVFNLIHGNAELTRRLVSHSDVDVVFFTGSYEKGYKVKKEVLADYWKTVVLNLAGKNGTLIWKDANVKKALSESLYGAFVTTGQRRTSTHSILVHKDLFEPFLSEFHKRAKKCRIGYGFTPDTDAPFMGPLVSEHTMENYIRYQGIANREGCQEIMRGKTLERPKRGYYVSPSIHVVTQPSAKSVYQKDEFFGPNVAFYAIEDLEQAFEILNQTRFGLVASVYTETDSVYRRFLHEAQVGTVCWNCPTTTDQYELPGCGLKKSGNARPMGPLAYLNCTYTVGSLITQTESCLPEMIPGFDL